ncbi:Lrp/AsnC ligand binding domain-containing protein [Luteimonas saliphila]|uniref:Lrp/AsnC ligand binding domain-containing protein n=1 Tax=Luteimonas saliphila TaxID=2804919 RepID=UPI00192E2C23
MDAIDRRLLELLREDASRPLKTLAAEVGLSRSSVRDRIVRMQAQGVIRRYTIETPAQDGALSAICMLRLLRTPDMRVVESVTAMPEVVRCDALSGEIDLLVEVAAADAAALNETRDRIAALPGVVEVTTSVVLTRY